MEGEAKKDVKTGKSYVFTSGSGREEIRRPDTLRKK